MSMPRSSVYVLFIDDEAADGEKIHGIYATHEAMMAEWRELYSLPGLHRYIDLRWEQWPLVGAVGEVARD